MIKREIYKRYPWLVLDLFHAFVEAKKEVECVTSETMKSYFDNGLVDTVGQPGL